MRYPFGTTVRSLSLLAVAGAMAFAPPVFSQTPDAIQGFRSSYAAMIDSFDQIFRQQGNRKGMNLVSQARATMGMISDAQFARVFTKSGVPDLAEASAAMQGAAAIVQRSAKPQMKSLPFPSADSVIDACVNTPHDDQLTYDALIASQVTSSILSAAAWVCNEDILGENGSLACVPLAIADDIAQGFFAVRSFCAGLESGVLIAGNYDRLEHIHTDLGAAQTAIIDSVNASTTSINSNIDASRTSINNNINTSTASIISNANANTTTIINNANTNRDILVGELHALGCEIVRLLNTPEGQRASSILACSAQPGFPYKWNKH